MEEISNPDDEWGVIPRSVEYLFDQIESNSNLSCDVYCSFFQVYNENIYDLLGSSSSSTLPTSLSSTNPSRYGEVDDDEEEEKIEGEEMGRDKSSSSRHLKLASALKHTIPSLEIREMKKRGNKKEVFISGLSQFRVSSTNEVMRTLQEGTLNRAMRSTEMNQVSSRSHAILQLKVHVEERGEGGNVHVREAKLSLVDLAGSEKMNTDSSISKAHFSELTSINQSLSTLGKVISALAKRSSNESKNTSSLYDSDDLTIQPSGGGGHFIPYRESKLTRILQDSLGGNTKTLLIACVSPTSLPETISTLQFADRVKRVSAKVKPNVLVDDKAMLARAQTEIARLRLIIRQLTKGRPLDEVLGESNSDLGSSESGSGEASESQRLILENNRLREENRRLRDMVTRKKGVSRRKKSAKRRGSKSDFSFSETNFEDSCQQSSSRSGGGLDGGYVNDEDEIFQVLEQLVDVEPDVDLDQLRLQISQSNQESSRKNGLDEGWDHVVRGLQGMEGEANQEISTKERELEELSSLRKGLEDQLSSLQDLMMMDDDALDSIDLTGILGMSDGGNHILEGDSEKIESSSQREEESSGDLGGGVTVNIGIPIEDEEEIRTDRGMEIEFSDIEDGDQMYHENNNFMEEDHHHQSHLLIEEGGEKDHFEEMNNPPKSGRRRNSNKSSKKEQRQKQMRNSYSSPYLKKPEILPTSSFI